MKKFILFYFCLFLFFVLLSSCTTAPQKKNADDGLLQSKYDQLTLDFNNLEKKDNNLLFEIQNLKSKNVDLDSQIAILKKQIDDLKKTNSDLRTINKSKSDLESKINALTQQRDDYLLQIDLLQSRINADELKAQKENQLLQDAENYLRNEFADLIKKGDVDIYIYKGILAVSFNDSLLFDPDSDKLKPNVQTLLTKLAVAFNKVPSRDVRIEGNTAAGVKSRWPSSWELGAMRAVNIARFLQEKAGIDPHRIRAVSLGEYNPIVINNNENNRIKNRRVDIMLVNRDLFNINKMQNIN
jgi:chemotaxis protein MotB